MKFFTPELHAQGNAADDDLVDQAEAEWERRLKRYRRHYKKIEAQLPLRFRKFHEEQCLHDADVFAPALLPANVPWKGPEVVIVAQQINTLIPEFLNTLAILEYTIAADPVVEIPLQTDVFHRSKPIWLYDEVDVAEPGVFSHEILVSDGRVIKLLFRDFNYHIAPLCLPTEVAGAPAPPKERMASA
ncbi:MAG: hypothetical protein HYS12_26515 [Planctomycetes bacterium]|nr:hypothetical protein [Planctomycetota bacterium]